MTVAATVGINIAAANTIKSFLIFFPFANQVSSYLGADERIKKQELAGAKPKP